MKKKTRENIIFCEYAAIKTCCNNTWFTLHIWHLTFIFHSAVGSKSPPVQVWDNKTYNEALLTKMSGVLQNNTGCFTIPTERPLLFFVKKTLHKGDVPVTIRGHGLQCVPDACPSGSMLTLQTDASCDADGRSPFCGPPEICTPTTQGRTSCTFTCKCVPEMKSRSCFLQIAVYIRLETQAKSDRQPPRLCGFTVDDD